MENIKFEKSCGAVVYKMEGNKPYYLLICDKSGYWGFPKGHIEGNESEHDTALREIKEETNIDVCFIGGFREEDQYSLAREGRPNTVKQTVYFLANYENQIIQAQLSEIDCIELMDFQSAVNALKEQRLKEILVQANNSIENSV